jgi:non-specific serine/threonine protein kinase
MPLEAGQTVSQYRLLEKLGEGGMGVVWRAEDTRLGRQVALKVLHASAAADPARRARFEQEAKAAAALNHPNIVTLFSVEEAEGIHFLTLEVVEGRPLGTRITAEGMSMRELLEIALPMTDAIAAAHARGIVHRDLKPDNVMISREGRVKVLDFGLAKLREEEPLLGGSGSLSPTQTQAGTLLGTLLYMSPEQAQGEPADARSDVFSLGVLLFEMATGRRPFAGSNPVAVISSVLKDPTPSLADEPHIPVRLGQILRRCLEKEPDARYPSARELRDDLRVLREELSTGTSAPSGERPIPWSSTESSVSKTAPPRRRRALLGLAGLAAVIAIPLMAWTLWRGGGVETPPAIPAAKAQPSLAILPLLTPDADPESQSFADGIHDDLIMQASRIRAMKTISRTSVMRYRESDLSLAEVAAELGVSSIVEGSVRRAGDRVRVNVKLIDPVDERVLWGDTFDRELTAENIFAIQSEIVRQVATALEATLTESEDVAIAEAPTKNLEAYTQYRLGMALDRENPTEENLVAKVAAFEAATRLDPGMAQGWARLAIAHVQLYWRGYDRSEERRALSASALEQATSIRPDLPEVAMARGFYRYWGFRDYPAALEAFETAERGLPNDVSVIAAKSFIERRLGRWDESLDTLHRALALDPLNAYLLQNLSNTYWVLRRWDDALRVIERAERLRPDSPWALVQRAGVQLQRTGEPALALALPASALQFDTDLVVTGFRLARDFEGGLAFVDSLPEGPRAEQISWTSTDLLRGEYLRLAGRAAEAAAPLRRTRDELAALLAADREDPRLHAAMGLTLALLGEGPEAIAAAERAAALVPPERDAMDSGTWLMELCTVQALVERRADAVACLDRYLAMPGYFGVEYFAREPRFDSVRDEPAFLELVARYGE